MRNKKNPAQPPAESMESATERLQRLLGQQPRGGNGDDDILSNPELAKLFGNLSKGFDPGVADDAPVTPMAEPLTLESLAASLEPAAVTLPAAAVAPQPAGACSKCGSLNPAATRFCGMCGHGLGEKLPKTAGNGAKPSLPEPPQLAQISSATSSSLGFKTALLGGLVLVLAGVVYQNQLWREPVLAAIIARARNAWASPEPAANPAAEPAPPTVKKQPEPDRNEPAVIRTPAIVVRPSKPSPTIVRRGLPEPAPVASAPLPQEIPLPPLPSASAAESPAPSPDEPPPVVTAQPATTGEVPATKSEPPEPSQIVPGKLIVKVNPEYPSVARAARVQGEVVMHATIGTDGTVQSLRVVRGSPLLVNAAMEAVKKWRYQPYMLDGKAVEGETDITITFKGE